MTTPTAPAAGTRKGLRRGVIVLALGSTLVTLAALYGVGEWLVRSRERNRSTVPGTMPTLYYRHNRLLHALVRNMNYFDWVNVNAQGFRGSRPVRLDPSPDTVRIMAIGASTTFDGAVSADSQAWPARLERWLGRLAPQCPVEVINAGVPGYRVFDNLIRLQADLYEYRPDLVLLYEGHNDLLGAVRRGAGGARASSGPDRPGEVASVTPWGHWLERHSLLYNKLLYKWRAITFARAGAAARARATASPVAAGDSSLAAGTGRFRSDLLALLAVARTHGLRVALLEIPNVSGAGAVTPDSNVRAWWAAGVPFVSPEEALRAYVRFNAAVAQVAAETRSPYLATAGLGVAGSDMYADGDPIHFNDRGADRMGEGLARSLIAQGLLTTSRTPTLRCSQEPR